MEGNRNQPPRVLFVGSFMPSAALERYPSADLAMRLSASGWTTLLTARRETRLGRLTDMVLTIYRKREDFDLAVVDVFSGKAFFLAEAAACSQSLRFGKNIARRVAGRNRKPAYKRGMR